MSFSIQPHPIDVDSARGSIASLDCGGFVFFEGRVRDHQDGQAVTHLHYEAYRELAEKEGTRIVAGVCQKYDVRAAAVHAVGELQPGDLAVWVGAAAAHREAAFAACRDLIDAIKARVPIWKREVYADGHSEWIEGCGSHDHKTLR